MVRGRVGKRGGAAKRDAWAAGKEEELEHDKKYDETKV